MAALVRPLLKVLAVAIAAASFVLAALLVLGSTTSLAVVAPSGRWLFAAYFVVPPLVGLLIRRVTGLIR